VKFLEEAFYRSGIPIHISGKRKEDGEDWICPQREEDVSIDVEKVSLMTLHAAKGLEFPVVFIVGCEQDILPLQLGTLSADQGEERRLFYVGMTRAKERLYLLRATRRRIYGRMMKNSPSPFLADIEDELKEFDIILQRAKTPQNIENQLPLLQ